MVAVTWMSFNGAAPVRARKVPNAIAFLRHKFGFNGAAPVRARKAFVGTLLKPCISWLQRGRACEGAEGLAV